MSENHVMYRKTADGLANHAFACTQISTVYLWGGIGEVITPKVIWEKRKEYSDVYPLKTCVRLLRCVGRDVRGMDCSGLIKNYLMGGLDHYSYDPKLDLNSAMLLERASVSGGMDTLPEKCGVCLFLPGHVGIYMGEGLVVESTSNPRFGNGVVKTALADRQWTHWFYAPGIEYEEI